MKNLCIIPARGGSKRIPRKNIKPFLGKPIIAYSIEVALQSGLFEEVMVSTDDEEIAEVAREYGAKVPFMRSEENANDHATTAAVLLEVLDRYKDLNRQFNFACCIYPTAPLLQRAKLEEAFELLTTQNFDSVFPVVPFSYPIWRSLHRNKEGKVDMNWIEYQNTRSQDLPPAYHDAGQFYWFAAEKLALTKTLYMQHSGSIVLEEMEVQDIDNPVDWSMAELKFGFIQNA